MAPGAGEPYSAALVVEVAEAIGGACRGPHGPDRGLGAGVGDAGLQKPSTSGQQASIVPASRSSSGSFEAASLVRAL
jgi:hypothetical protein